MMTQFQRRIAMAGAAWIAAAAIVSTANASVRTPVKDECRIDLDIDGELAGIFKNIEIDGVIINEPGDLPSGRANETIHLIELSGPILIEPALTIWQEEMKLGDDGLKAVDITIGPECTTNASSLKFSVPKAELYAGAGAVVTIKGAVVMIN